MSQYLVDRILADANIEVRYRSEVAAAARRRPPRAADARRPGHRRDRGGADQLAVRLHRRLPAHRLARRRGGPRRPRLRRHRARPARRAGRPAWPLDATAVRPGDQHARRVRGRRRPAGLDEAGRLGRRRGRDGGATSSTATWRRSDARRGPARRCRSSPASATTQLDQLAEAGTEVAIEPGTDLFTEGEHADFWWVLVDGALELVRRTGREDTVVGHDGRPRVGGPAGSGRGTSDGVYLATGRGRRPGRVLRVPAGRLRELFDDWFPFGVHLISGLYRTARSIESTARQRDSLVTLGTLAAGLAHEINNPAAAATRAVDALEEACDDAAVLARAAGRAARSRPHSSSRSTGCGGRSAAARRADPLDLADREDELVGLAGRARRRRGVDDRPDARRGRRRRRLVRPGGRPARGRGAGAGLAVGGQHAARPPRCSAEVKESTRRVSELVAAVRSYSQMDRASRQPIDVSEGLESTLVMLGAQAPRRGRPWCGTTPPTCRGSRPTRAS